jgi:hypothetical protein
MADKSFADGLPHKTFAADFTLHPWLTNAAGHVEWQEQEELTLPLVRRCVPTPPSLDRAGHGATPASAPAVRSATSE